MRVVDHYVSHPRAARKGDEVLYLKYGMDAGAFSVGNPANMTFLDVACSMPLGWSGERPRSPRASSLEEACTRMFASSFERGRCYIPFSGGRESSMWLATATRYARRNGHDDPIPVTLRYPGLASANELQVQERVVTHLGFDDWERVEPDGGLDLIGPVARATLARTGPLWPPNAYMMAPVIEAARDGVFVLITGVTDFFSWWRWGPLMGVFDLHRRPTRHDLSLAAAALMPAPLRVRAARRHGAPPPMPWLRPVAEREALELLRRRQAAVPLRCDRAMADQITHRCFIGGAGTFRALGEAFGTSIDQPLHQSSAVDSFAGASGWRGFRGLSDALRRMCGDLLPPEVLIARPAPDLTRLFFGDASREFAAGWSGAGLDHSVVDAAALRRNWLSDTPDPRTACLLQFAWLTEQVSDAGSVTTTDELLVTQP